MPPLGKSVDVWVRRVRVEVAQVAGAQDPQGQAWRGERGEGGEERLEIPYKAVPGYGIPSPGWGASSVPPFNPLPAELKGGSTARLKPVLRTTACARCFVAIGIQDSISRIGLTVEIIVGIEFLVL